MTTNVVDRHKRIVACDSRWSREDKEQKLLFYVDDTGYDKIANRRGATMVCSGYGPLIEKWKQWFLALNFDFNAMPETEMVVDGVLWDISLSVCEKPKCLPLYIHGQVKVYGDQALFSGSGMLHAFACFTMNRCGKRAVETASQHDFATGGTTQYVEFDSGVHNLSSQNVTLAQAIQQMNERGMVMDLQTKKVVPIQEHNAGHKGDTESAVGSLTLSAPTGLAPRAWLDSEKAELRKAFERIAEIESGMPK